jgi:hypothetical protein
MKKWLFVFAAFFVLLLISPYALIPSNIIISKVTAIECSHDGAFKILSDESTWSKWWPVSDSLHHHPATAKPVFVFQKDSYEPGQLYTNGVQINIRNNESSLSSSLMLFPLRDDSVVAEWQCTMAASHNPFARIAQYLRAVTIKKNMNTILTSLHDFLQIQKNVYGITISETSITDTLLVATKSLLSAYPSTRDIYRSAAILKNYIASKGAKVTGRPMVNVTKINNNQFEMMVAIPANRELQADGNIFFRKMIPGNFLVTEVRGDISAINAAQKGMEDFMADYQKTSMAIPFQSLITDRTIEADSSKWITKLYEPVMK